MGRNENNLIIFILIVLVVFGIGYYYSPKLRATVSSISSNIASIINIQQDIFFAGYNWDVIGEGILSNGCSSSSGTFTRDANGFIVLTATSSSCKSPPQTNIDVCMITKEEISDVDEFLPMWKGSGSGNTGNWGRSASNGMLIGLYDKITQNKFVIISRGCGTSSGFNAQECEWSQEPTISKFMNNFDGTYSSYTYLGIGDVYVKDTTFDTKDWQSRYLMLCAFASTDTESGHSSVLTIFNIVTKKLEAPLCKAGQVLLPNGSCENLESILLARESAIYESLEEKIKRIEERLQAREEGLQRQIIELQELLKSENKQEQLDLINQKLVELNQKLAIATDTTQIELLKQQINSLEDQIGLLEDETDRERMELQISALQKELELTVKSAETDQIKAQISFYESQLGLLTSKSDERFDYLSKELDLTKIVLDGIQSGEIVSPPDVDIEDIISKVLGRIEVQETIIQRGLTDEEVKTLIDNEMNIQFQKRFPSGLSIEDKEPSIDVDTFSLKDIPSWVWIGLFVFIVLIIILSTRKR